METQKERSRKHYLLHKDEVIARSAAYHKAHPEMGRQANALPTSQAARKRYAIEHKEEIQEYQNAWQRAHPIVGVLRAIKRRARKANSEGSYSAKEWDDLCRSYLGACVYCGVQPEKLTADHIVPLSKGGSNFIENIVPACKSCNSSKHNKSLLSFLFKRMR